MSGSHESPEACSVDENPYLLLTPGPLSTSRTVRRAMLRDWCTWDDDYNQGVVQVIRQKLIQLATDVEPARERYSSVLMQGSGTFCVESVIGSALPSDGKLLVLANGAYGRRIARIARVLKIEHILHDEGEVRPTDLQRLDEELRGDFKITHVAMVHAETTTGMLNPLEDVARTVRAHGRTLIVDAMSTFGGIPIDMEAVGIDFIVSSANKCVQGVPGFGFIVASRRQLEATRGLARSLSLDLHEQWSTMEAGGGKWRFTSPTHTVRAFAEALTELDLEGGVSARFRRYRENQRMLVDGMEALGFRCLLPRSLQSPIITAFHEPSAKAYSFQKFYTRLKEQGFVIYPGKVTNVDTFRIGNIGEVYPADVQRLLGAVQASIDWKIHDHSV